MKEFKFSYDLFRKKLIIADNIYENNFEVLGTEKYEDCWIGYSSNDNRYWLGLTEDGKNAYDYSSADEMLNAPVFDGKSMHELWDKVVFWSINGLSADDWFVHNCVNYYTCRKQDSDNVAKLACKLWKDADYTELKSDFEVISAKKNEIVYTAYCNEEMIAFAHCSIRNEYVEGSDSSEVAYLEAIFVEEKYRKVGIATYLIRCCENWAKKKGCCEFASDCDVHNSESRKMHEANGFMEVSTLVHYIKKLINTNNS